MGRVHPGVDRPATQRLEPVPVTRRALAVLGLGLGGLVLAACRQAPADTAASLTPAAKPATKSDGATASPRSSSTAKASPSGSSDSGAEDGDGSYVPQVAPDTVTTSGSQPQVHFTVKTKKPVYFITIDDGVRKQQAAVDYVRSIKLPVTTFLYDGVVDGEYDYFKKFSAYDAVQNHTMEHKALSKKSTDVQYQICEAQRIYEKKYGERPWILRPPYGAGMYESNTAAQRNRILDAAASCGIKHIAMWNVVVDADGSVSYASGDKIRRGDIVLLHFEGDVAANLKKVVRLGEASGLTPASLSAFLGK